MHVYKGMSPLRLRVQCKTQDKGLKILSMNRNHHAETQVADSVDMANDRQLAVVLALGLEAGTGQVRTCLEASGASRELIEQALRLLRNEPREEEFLYSAVGAVQGLS